jgi:hypothetical protein
VVDDGEGEVVAVDEGDVVEGLVVGAAALEGEFSERRGDLALGGVGCELSCVFTSGEGGRARLTPNWQLRCPKQSPVIHAAPFPSTPL